MRYKNNKKKNGKYQIHKPTYQSRDTDIFVPLHGDRFDTLLKGIMRTLILVDYRTTKSVMVALIQKKLRIPRDTIY